MGKFKWGQKDYERINCKPIKQGSKGCSKKENINITKLMFDWVNKGNQKGGMNQKTYCPCCGVEEETLTHIFQCKESQMASTRQESIEVMKKTLQGTNGPDQVMGPYLEMIQSISNDREVELTGNICLIVAEAVEDKKG